MSEVNINYKGSKIAGMDASGTKTLLTEGKYCEGNISVEYNKPAAPTPSLQSKTYTVDSAGTATVTADSGYDGLSSVAVSVPSADPFVNIYGSSFYTEGNQRKWREYPRMEISVADGDKEGWLSDGYSKQGEPMSYNAVPSGTVITPTESSQTIGGANYMMENVVTVNAIPSNYVGSGITQRSSSDLTASGATVTVPSGYYAEQASKAVATGTTGTPTATKGTVSNHSVSVTPSVTNTTGYITGSTKTGTAVTVSASELVSGTLNVTSSGTKDVTNYASASIPSGSTTVNEAIDISSMMSVSISSSGKITATADGYNLITPSVTAGYISSGTQGEVDITGSATKQLTAQGYTVYDTSTTDQTIMSGTYLTGNQVIKAVSVSGLSANTILSGTTVKIGDVDDDDRIASVTGTVTFSTIYTGSSNPSSSTGVNGDIYLKVI